MTASDNCLGPITPVLTISPSNGFCSPTVPLVRTWTATDACGNAITHTQRINCSSYTPDPYVTGHQPALIPSQVSLSATGRLSLAFTWPVVLTRNFTDG